MLRAFAMLGFLVLPGLLALDLMAPGRHFGARRSPARLVMGGAAALSVALGLSGALALFLACQAWLPRTGWVMVLGAVAGALLDRLLGAPLDRLADGPPGPRLVTPALWLDDGLRRLALRSLFAGLVFFGALRVPAAVGLVATLVFVRASARAVADAVATPVGFDEARPTHSGEVRASSQAA